MDGHNPSMDKASMSFLSEGVRQIQDAQRRNGQLYPDADVMEPNPQQSPEPVVPNDPVDDSDSWLSNLRADTNPQSGNGQDPNDLDAPPSHFGANRQSLTQAVPGDAPEPDGDGYPYVFERTRYKNFQELKKGVDTKDRVIDQQKEELVAKDQEIAQRDDQIRSLHQQLQMVANLYGQEVPDEEAQIEMFAQQLMPDELRNKTAQDFRVSRSDFAIDESRYEVRREDYDDDVDYQEAKAEAKKRRIAAEEKAQKRFEEKQQELAASYQQWVSEIERAKATVRQGFADEKRKLEDAEVQRRRALNEAKEALDTEIDAKSLGLVNHEDEFLAKEILFKKPIRVKGGESDLEVPLADVMVLLRMKYGKRLTDLIIKGVRQEIRGGEVVTATPPEPYSNDSMSPARPAPTRRYTPPAPPSDYQKTDSEKLFESSGWTTRPTQPAVQR